MSTPTRKYPEIQPEDEDSTSTVVRNRLQKEARQRREEEARAVEAYVRRLLRETRVELSGRGDGDHAPRTLLDEAHRILRSDPTLGLALHPGTDALEHDVQVAFRQMMRARERGYSPNPETELEVTTEVATVLGYVDAAGDMTRYAPVRLEKLDVEGAKSPVEGVPSPIGRVRIAADSYVDVESRTVEIPHEDCEHVLTIANPRKGKDSFGARICGNLKDEHGYKWFSLFDDGRNETPMIATPNDEEPIQESLDALGQEPKGYDTDVFVPAIGLPDELPANFQPFTIGVDSLTTDIVATLAGVTPDATTERRISHALDEVQRRSGSVDRLIARLEELAEDTTAVVTVERLPDDEDDLDPEQETETYQMGEDDLLHDVAEALMMLAAEGLLADAGTDTNLDMHDVMRRQESVAVLNCNTLPRGSEHLKFLLTNLWLRLIYEARDSDPSLPRAAVELREIKNLAPSKLQDTKYKSVVKALQQTIYFIATQGGSRRVLMVGSTQKLTDVYKSVRTNMPIQVLLQMSSGTINTLESQGADFSPDERRQLQEFSVGWGMVRVNGEKHYPIHFSGARCGLSLGDVFWQHRYASAMGARVREQTDGWTDADCDMWIDMDGDVHDPDESTPKRHEWYLTGEDVDDPTLTPGESLPEVVVLGALERRQPPYPVPDDLRPQSVDVDGADRSLDLMKADVAEAKERRNKGSEYGVSQPLQPWLEMSDEVRSRCLSIVEAVQDHDISSYDDVAEHVGFQKGTVSRYVSDKDRVGRCIVKEDGQYRTTELGAAALGVPWDEAVADLG